MCSPALSRRCLRAWQVSLVVAHGQSHEAEPLPCGYGRAAARELCWLHGYAPADLPVVALPAVARPAPARAHLCRSDGAAGLGRRGGRARAARRDVGGGACAAVRARRGVRRVRRVCGRGGRCLGGARGRGAAGGARARVRHGAATRDELQRCVEPHGLLLSRAPPPQASTAWPLRRRTYPSACWAARARPLFAPCGAGRAAEVMARCPSTTARCAPFVQCVVAAAGSAWRASRRC